MKGIILKPILTEKQTAVSEKIETRYGFRVVPSANKEQIKKAIEEIYDVKIVKVNTMKYAGKKQNRHTKSGVITGRTSSFKKAIVTLKDGDSIDLFSNI